MNIVGCVMAVSPKLPPIQAEGYEYVLAGNGLFIRAEDSRMEAMIPVAPASLHGLATVEPYARLKVPLISSGFLWSLLDDARKAIPREAMYHFFFVGGNHPWRCTRPAQAARVADVRFKDFGEAVVDLHSHGDLGAFFSSMDDNDEMGLRFYAVIGNIGSEWPQVMMRVGVYGHRWTAPLKVVFDGSGPFVEKVDDQIIEQQNAAFAFARV